MGPALVALAHTSGTASTANVTTFNMVPTSSYTRSFCSPISRRSLIACVRITIWVHTFAFLISFCIPIPEEARTGLGLCRSNSDTLFYILTRLFLPTFLMLLVHCLSTILYIHYVASLSPFWPPSLKPSNLSLTPPKFTRVPSVQSQRKPKLPTGFTRRSPSPQSPTI